MGRLDLNLLLVLDALFDERNVTAVARRLRVSQPTVSFSLKKLREFFNDELFVRQGATMQPTPFIETITSRCAASSRPSTRKSSASTSSIR